MRTVPLLKSLSSRFSRCKMRRASSASTSSTTLASDTSASLNIPATLEVRRNSRKERAAEAVSTCSGTALPSNNAASSIIGLARPTGRQVSASAREISQTALTVRVWASGSPPISGTRWDRRRARSDSRTRYLEIPRPVSTRYAAACARASGRCPKSEARAAISVSLSVRSGRPGRTRAWCRYAADWSGVNIPTCKSMRVSVLQAASRLRVVTKTWPAETSGGHSPASVPGAITSSSTISHCRVVVPNQAKNCCAASFASSPATPPGTTTCAAATYASVTACGLVALTHSSISTALDSDPLRGRALSSSALGRLPMEGKAVRAYSAAS